MIRPLLQQTPTPSFDRPFLNEIQDSFVRIWHSPEAVPYLLATFLIICVVVFIGVLYNRHLRRRRSKSALPAGWFVDAEKIREILETAWAQRSKFEMRFLPADQSRRITTCALQDLGVDTLLLEPPAYVETGQNWVGREIECFFRVHEEHGQISFYRFTSTIKQVSYTQQDIGQLVLDTPKLLHNHQKRAFLRIAPPSHFFMGMAIWLERRLPQGHTGAPAEDLSQWGRPMFTYIPDKDDNPVQVDNISAGGLRLGIQRAVAKHLNFELRLADRIVVLLDLYDPENEKKKRFWLRCRVQNINEDIDTRDLKIGVQYIGQGRLAENGDKKILWFDLGSDGVEPLAVWVMQRHLELFREKGIE